MKTWILAAATLLLVQGVDARERRGPPSACPQPKVDCCEKPKCAPEKPCAPKAKVRKPSCTPACNPDPCCPPVCFEKGFPTDPCCTPSAYSEPADIELQSGWDTLITANFIYWDVQQGGMDLAYPGQGTITDGVLVGSATPSCIGGNIVQQGTAYTPGFQVGLGWSGPKDNWVLYAEYTWLHGSTTTTADGVNPTISTLNGTAVPQNGVLFPIPWMPSSGNIATTHLSSTWTYKIDLVDAQVSRPFYSGTRFILEPFFGLRGASIRQKLHMQTTNLQRSSAVNGPTRDARYSSRGNGIGPRAGLNGEWHLGYGTRFIGNASASVLYTEYHVRENVANSDLGVLPLIMELDNLKVLRPNLDLSLGLGWGSYLFCRRFHMDLSATYDFSLFWSQNMMRYLSGSAQAGAASAPDLYLQGLTIQTRFDF